MARLPRLFRTRSWVRWKKSHSCRFGITEWDFFFFILCIYWCLDEAILCEHTIYLQVKHNRKDIPIIPPDLALWLTFISSNYPCLEHISWFQRCSSRWSSTVSMRGDIALFNCCSTSVFVEMKALKSSYYLFSDIRILMQ